MQHLQQIYDLCPRIISEWGRESAMASLHAAIFFLFVFVPIQANHCARPTTNKESTRFTLTSNDHISVHYMCSDDWKYATPWWKHSIIVYEKNLYSFHSPSHRIFLRGMEWRTDSESPTLTRLIFERTWNNASSPPEKIRLTHSCASSLNAWKVSSRSFVLITSLPHIEHIWLFAQKALLSCPLYKKSATLISVLPWASSLWNTLPFDVQSSKSLGMFKSKLKPHLSL